MDKRVLVRPKKESGDTGPAKEVYAPSIEQALKKLVKHYEEEAFEVPCTIEFEGPGGLQFAVTVTSADDMHELSTQGFMF